jgi:hypothetical protein
LMQFYDYIYLNAQKDREKNNNLGISNR